MAVFFGVLLVAKRMLWHTKTNPGKWVYYLPKALSPLASTLGMKTDYEVGGTTEQQTGLQVGGTREQQTGLQPRFQWAGAKASSLPRMHLMVVACGDRMNETLTMLKSAAALTGNGSLVFHIFSETSLQARFAREVSGGWGVEARGLAQAVHEKIEYRVYDITVTENATWWERIFSRPCAYQRLFLHSLLTDVDAAIYVDTDIVFLTSVTSVWDNFARFNASQTLGMVANHESKTGGGWYKHETKLRGVYVHPSAMTKYRWWGFSGVNSGVMLMNLTRLRHWKWSDSTWHYSHVYRKQLFLVDQDLVNIYLHFHPDQLFWLDCTLNFRTDHCRWSRRNSTCLSAEKQGVRILHGNRQAFHRNKVFSSIYDDFVQYKLGDDLHAGLLYKLRDRLRNTTPCTTPAFQGTFLKQLTEVVATLTT
ncbi:glucoside xylosyltransferase 2-like [Babylonia areolata]|uniref:glucoside xylosyltransferase 2-like n=1 Tax=Babylonia areolata TaxID=304850 RepID=UPI003FD57ADA